MFSLLIRRFHIIRPTTNQGKMKTENIQLPKQMDYNDGESVFKLPSGMTKKRKGQSEEEYLVQKDLFWNSGPVVQNHTFITDYVEKVSQKIKNDTTYSISEVPKIERENALHGLERLYFERDYDRCLEKATLMKQNIFSQNPDLDLKAKKNKNLNRIVNELDSISNTCLKKIQSQNESNVSNL